MVTFCKGICARQLVSSVLLSFACITTALSAEPNLTIAELSANPIAYLNQQVVVSGKLDMDGEYMGNHDLFLVDANGKRFEVTSWAPYEVMIPPPGSNAIPPMTMIGYINKELIVSGWVRASTPEQRNYSPYVIDVDSAEIVPSP